MEKVNKVLQFPDLTVNSRSDDYCYHTTQSFNREYKKAYPKQLLNGELICYECWKEQNNKLLEEAVNHHSITVDRERKKNMFVYHSILGNESIRESRLSTFKTECEETEANKIHVQEIISRIKAGEVLNVFIVGLQGTGKSHLAYSILHELMVYYWRLSDGGVFPDPEVYNLMKSALYVETETLMRKVRASFRDKESKYTEDYCVNLMTNADFLVIDDLGAESGSMNKDDEASNFIQRILYGVTNGRQGKTTIFTTNLSGQSLFKKYDPKLVSRILKDAEVVKFEKTSDKRIEHLKF